MDKSSDKQQSVRRFQCPHCSEKPFTTKANMLRHITRKHKDVFETEAGINNDNPPIETPTIDMLDEYLETVPSCIEPEPLPGDEYLITLIRECEKYQHLFPAIKRQMKWNENNATIDLHYHLRKHNKNMVYLMVDILRCIITN
jgi:hypothetical protein